MTWVLLAASIRSMNPTLAKYLQLFSFISLAACSIAPLGPVSSSHPFLKALKSSPSQIWAAQVNEKLKQTVTDFNAHRALENGAEYGKSIRTLELQGKCAADLDQELSQMSCKRVNDVLKEPKHNQPLRTQDGKTIPMISYLCPDGGVVRVKPSGDPMSRFRPQPHASKSLRYPYDSTFETFDDEIVKVDNHGNAIPKWVKDLNLNEISTDQKSAYIEDWANDAHTDLLVRCKNEE